MRAIDLFSKLADAGLPDFVAAVLGRRDTCIASTRYVCDVAAYYGVDVRPLPTRVIAYNAAYKAHLDACEEPDIAEWRKDGSYSVGAGFGIEPGKKGYDAHLIVEGGGWFADFTVGQIERKAHGIVIGSPALIGRLPESDSWSVNIEAGYLEYIRDVEPNIDYRRAPDWRSEHAARRRMVGALIRKLRNGSALSPETPGMTA